MIDSLCLGSRAQAFVETAMKSALLRKYIRLHHTPPPRLQASEEDTQRIRDMLAHIVTRHWRLNEKAFRHAQVLLLFRP